MRRLPALAKYDAMEALHSQTERNQWRWRVWHTDGQIPEGPRENLCPNLSTKWMRPYFSSEPNQNEFDLNKIMLPIFVAWSSDLLYYYPGYLYQDEKWDSAQFKWYILVDSIFLSLLTSPLLHQFAQPRTLKTNISQPLPRNPTKKVQEQRHP